MFSFTMGPYPLLQKLLEPAILLKNNTVIFPGDRALTPDVS